MRKSKIVTRVDFPAGTPKRGFGYTDDSIWFEEKPKDVGADARGRTHRLFSDGVWRRLYLRRRILWGKWFTLRIHTFYSGDEDTPHDHPWSFITFPLRSYYEHVYDTMYHGQRLVRAFRFHYRPAKYRHSVATPSRPVVTLVITGPKTNDWGFWPSKFPDKFLYEAGEFVPYREWVTYDCKRK